MQKERGTARVWTDALGTATVFGISALILNWLLFRSELVPRWLSVWGLFGGVLIVIAGVRGLYGHSPSSTLSVLLALPIGIQEMVFAVWLIVKGFRDHGSSQDLMRERLLQH